MNFRGQMDGWFGDEPEIETEARERKQAYEDEHADDWKYNSDNWV